MTELTVRLVVSDADAAIDFYRRAFGAELRERYRDDAIGKVVHAAVTFDGVVLSLKDEASEHGDLAPTTLGSPGVALQLVVDDPDAVGARMAEAGATVVFPIEDQFYGHREGRLRDPFGHVWIVGRAVAALDPAEVQRRVDAWARRGGPPA